MGNPTPADYRPTTILNSDYKMLARMFARRLCPIMEDRLTYTQTCGIPGNTIHHSVATVRDSITYAESRNIPLCVLSLDFKNAFDTVSHGYMFKNSTNMESVPHSSTAFGTCMKEPHSPYKSMAISTDQSPSDVQSARDVRWVWPCKRWASTH